jgi:hypothetical protein
MFHFWMHYNGSQTGKSTSAGSAGNVHPAGRETAPRGLRLGPYWRIFCSLSLQQSSCGSQIMGKHTSCSAPKHTEGRQMCTFVASPSQRLEGTGLHYTEPPGAKLQGISPVCFKLAFKHSKTISTNALEYRK